MARASQVKQEGATVCLPPVVIPALTGIATNAIPLLDLKQGDCSSLRVTPIVEILNIPTMKVSAVEKSEGDRLVSKKFYEKSGHFICYKATSIGQESLNHVGYIFKRRSWLQSRFCLSFMRYNYLTLFQFFFLLDMRLIRKLSLLDLFWNFNGSLKFNLRFD